MYHIAGTISGLIQSLSRYVRMSCVFAIAENPLPGGLETSGRRVYLLLWHISRQYCFFFEKILHSDFFGSLQTSLLCIMGELVVGGSVVDPVGISDR